MWRISGYETVVAPSDTVGAALSTALVEAADAALIQAEDAPFRFRLDPNAADDVRTGPMVRHGGSVLVLGRVHLRQFRAVRRGLPSATLRVTYFAREA